MPLNETPGTKFKLRIYNQHDPDKGNLDHEEFFSDLAEMQTRYEELIKGTLPALQPTIWERINGEWYRTSTISDLKPEYVSTELSHADANEFVAFLHKAGIYYEASECGELIHFEVKADKNEMEVCNDFLNTL